MPRTRVPITYHPADIGRTASFVEFADKEGRVNTEVLTKLLGEGSFHTARGVGDYAVVLTPVSEEKSSSLISATLEDRRESEATCLFFQSAMEAGLVPSSCEPRLFYGKREERVLRELQKGKFIPDEIFPATWRIIAPFCPGTSLDKKKNFLTDRQKCLTLYRTAIWLSQYTQRIGRIHGDVRSSNILITPLGGGVSEEDVRIYFIDGGRSRKIGEKAVCSLKDDYFPRDDPVIYHAPEVVLDSEEVSPPSANPSQDVFPWGYMILHVLKWKLGDFLSTEMKEWIDMTQAIDPAERPTWDQLITQLQKERIIKRQLEKIAANFQTLPLYAKRRMEGLDFSVIQAAERDPKIKKAIVHLSQYCPTRQKFLGFRCKGTDKKLAVEALFRLINYWFIEEPEMSFEEFWVKIKEVSPLFENALRGEMRTHLKEALVDFREDSSRSAVRI